MLNITFNAEYLSASEIAGLQALLSKLVPKEAPLLTSTPPPAATATKETATPAVTGDEVGTTGGGESVVQPTGQAAAGEVEKPRRGRPKKEAAAEPANPIQAEDGSAAAAAPSTEAQSQPAAAGAEVRNGSPDVKAEIRKYSVDELRAGLQKFTVANDLVKGKALLESCGCARVTELAEKPAEVQAEFMAKCYA